jgi:hypothetical protein
MIVIKGGTWRWRLRFILDVLNVIGDSTKADRTTHWEYGT